jgi:Uma2 family endonuclease
MRKAPAIHPGDISAYRIYPVLNKLLVIEVVSPGTEATDNDQQDYKQKPVEYADRGIPEMWQIDPNRQVVNVGTLVDGAYAFQTFTGQDAVVSLAFPKINLTAEAILQAGR